MCLFKKKKSTIKVKEEKKQLSQEEIDAIIKNVSGDEIVPFADDFSAKEQNLLDCIIDDDDENN